MKFSKIRERGSQWCKVEIELRNRNGKGLELSICGATGSVLSKREAKSEARAYWESFFEECPEEIKAMNERCGTRFRSPRSAATYVLQCDGPYHGLDVERIEGNTVYIGESFGQIRSEIAEFFPELAPLLVWHLNGMQAGCVHQRLQGRTYQTDPGHECAACGTKLGHAWYHWPLPGRVIEQIQAFKGE